MKRFFNERTLEELIGLYQHENKCRITEQQLEELIINQINTCCALKSDSETCQHYVERSVVECNSLNGTNYIVLFDDIKRAFVLYLLSLYYKTDLLDKEQNIIITQILDLPYNSKTVTMSRMVTLNEKRFGSVVPALYEILPKYNKPELLTL